MEGLVRAVALSPCIYSGRPVKTAEECCRLLEPLQEHDLIILPADFLAPPSLESLRLNKGLMKQSHLALSLLKESTKNVTGTVFTSLSVLENGGLSEKIVVLNAGKMVFFGNQQDCPIFQLGNLSIGVVLGDSRALAGYLAVEQPDLVVNLRYQSVMAGEIANELNYTKALSGIYHCGIAVVNGGKGDTSSPLFYRGFAGFFCNGKSLNEAVDGQWSSLAAEFDPDITGKNIAKDGTIALPYGERTSPTAPLSRFPYLPDSLQEKQQYLGELLDMQAESLAIRAKNIHAKRMLVGVSGGLDSTLALLVMAKAGEKLGWNKEQIVGVTMPGFGTSGRTYENAVALIRNLGAEFREIPIGKAVEAHLTDIGHPLDQRNVTYENAQARERTQILLDLANDLGGFVVGTGDLSEEALGWSTFGGDHLSNYNVNVCLTKTVVREMVSYCGEVYGGVVGDCLRDIVETPVSPELLPPDEAGGIAQKTEEILGPYALHDFFLYYMVRHGFSPDKLLAYGLVGFGEELGEEFVSSRLKLFLKRFAMGQFKRSCAPDSAVLTEISLSGKVFNIPSDLDFTEMVGQIK